MPLMETISPRDRMQMKLQTGFEALPQTDQTNIMELVNLGKRVVRPEDVEAHAIPDLSPEAKAFVESGLFREIYDINTHREVPAPSNMAGHEVDPMIRGLFEVIKQLTGGKGQIDPGNSNKVGGGEASGKSGKSGKSGFESKLSEGFQSGGPLGLANVHRSLLKDPGYNKFLEGDG